MRYVIAVAAVLVLSLVAVGVLSPAPAQAQQEAVVASDDSEDALETPWIVLRRRGNGLIGMSWNNVAGVTHYRLIVECVSAGCTDPPYDFRAKLRINSYAFLRKPLDQTYRVKIRAEHWESGDLSAWSAWSDWVDETPLPDLPDMDAPTVQAQENGDLVVNWTKLSGATHYLVQIDCISALCSHTLNGRGGDDSSFTFPARRMHSGKEYRARIVPADAHGTRQDWSDWSETAELPDLRQDIPQMAAPTATRESNGDLTISWTAVSGATGYVIEWACASDPCSHASTFKWHTSPIVVPVRKLHMAGDYRARVAPADVHGARDWSPWSDWSGTLEPPVIPQMAAPTATRESNGDLTISWTAVSGATGYVIEWDCVSVSCSHASTFKWHTSPIVVPLRKLHVVGEYRARVAPADVHGARDWSPWSETAEIPAIPQMAAPTATPKPNGDLTISWTAVVGATNYFIQYNCISTPRCSHHKPTVKSRTSPFVVQAHEMHTGGEYRARVAPADVHGSRQDWSPWSETATLSTLTAPKPPAFTVSRRTNGKLAINWTPDIKHNQYAYQLQCTSGDCPEKIDDSFTRVQAHGVNSYVLLSMPVGNTYKVRMFSVRINRASPWSDWVEEVPPPPLPAMAAPTLQGDAAGYLTVNWVPLNDVDDYYIHWECTSPSCSHEGYFKWHSSPIVIPPRKMRAGKDYRVRVAAYHEWGLRSWSDWTQGPDRSATAAGGGGS